MNGYPLFSSRRGFLSLILVLAIGLSLPACDSLDVTDPNAPNAADVTLQSLVSGIEGGLRVDVFVYLVASGTLTREVYNFDPADPRWVDELFVGPLDPGGFIVLRPWSSRYRVIRNTVTFMDRVASDLSGAGQSAASGFAKTIIGYQLLLNLNYMGDNSIKIEFSEDINTPFVSTAAAYAEIERYLDEGFSELQAGGGSFPFSLSSGFAGFDTPGTFAQFNRAIRARVALYQNDHSSALSALGNSFLDANGDMNTGVYHVYSTGAGDRLHPLFEVPTSPSVKLRAHPMYKAQAEAGDLRYTSKILDRSNDDFDPSPSAANGLSSALVVTVASGATSPLPIVRNEELLLMRAEANIGLNSLSAAEADINVVRAAAGLGPIALTVGNAIDQLLHERMYSLFLEGHRWVDVRRFDRLDQLPIDRPGDQIFRQFPRPLDEVPEGN
ncbi:MAG: RagB/SusD family nutrient uptake outer membrane protein [Rhodothermales bacterium]